jgi:hypothetical protein
MSVKNRLSKLEKHLQPNDEMVKIIYLTWDIDDELDTQDEVITKEEYVRRFGSEPVDAIRLSWEVDDENQKFDGSGDEK